MGSSPSRVAGKTTRTVTIAGREYSLSQPQTLGMFAETEGFILSRRKDEAIFAMHACELTRDRELQKCIWEGATRAARSGWATDDEWALFEKSPWKKAVLLFQTLDPKHHKEVPDVAAAMRLIESDAHLDKCMDLAATALNLLDSDQSLDNFMTVINVAGELLKRDGNLDRLVALLNVVSQEDAVKNSSGPTETPGPPQNPNLESHSTPDGQPSTTPSPSDSSGASSK